MMNLPLSARADPRAFASKTPRLIREALAGLTRSPKSLPSKFFYDERGSALFDRICQTPEYYPTRTELAIMRRHVHEIAHLIGPNATLIELGSGSSMKTRLLLDALSDAAMPAAAYIPVDISGSHLTAAARCIEADYPRMDVLPLHADYTLDFALPAIGGRLTGRTVVYFPGSTIGNFEPSEAAAFLRRIRKIAGPASSLLIGVDLKKAPDLLHAAYNDNAGVTAAFNLNVLDRLRREAGADFDLSAFSHYAFYEPSRGRIEMHLISRRAQTVHLAGHAIAFDQGESIHTENSYKYTPGSFHALARSAGYHPRQTWTDPDHLFSVHYFTHPHESPKPRREPPSQG